MVLPVGLDTPRTEIGNATFNPDVEFSMEKSFQLPARDENNLVDQIRNSRKGFDIKTPRARARAPLGDRRNPAAAPRGEFTPLLKSVTKGNHARRFGRESTALKSPAPIPESSVLYNGDSSIADPMSTPAPDVISSSATSTPLAMLPRRNGGGVLADGANMMTLREQENIINKIEKENFGLKLKIHFLEDALRKAGPGFGEAALKENTDLKVDKVTMQQELRRYRKTLTSAERDLETYRQQVLEAQERAKHQHADDALKQELEKLKDDVGDLEAELREKERIIDGQADEMDQLKEKAGQGKADDEEIAQYQADIDNLKETINNMEAAAQVAASEKQELEETNDRLEAAADAAEGEKQKLQKTINSLEVAAEAFGEEKQALEDEVVVLQGTLDEQTDQREQAIAATRQEANRELERAEEECRQLEAENADLRRQLSAAKQTREQESASADTSKQRLQIRIEEMEAKLRDEAARNDRLVATDGDLAQECDDLRKKLKDADIELESLESELREKDQTLAKLQSQESDVEELQEQVQQQNADIERFEDEVEDLREQVQEKDQKVKELSKGGPQLTELQDQLAKQTSDMEKLEDLVQELREQIDEKDNRIKDLGKGGPRMEELRKQLDEQESTIKKLRDADLQLDKLRLQTTEQESTIRKLRDADAQVDRLRIEISERDATIRTLKDADLQVRKLRSDLADRDVQIERLQDAEAQLKRLRKQVAEQDEHSGSRDDEHKQLRTRVKHLREQADDQQTRAETLEDEKKELRTQIKQLRQELVDEKAEFASHEEEVLRSRTQIRKLERSIQQTEREGARLVGNQPMVSEERNEMQSKLDKATAEVEQMRQAVVERDELVESVKTKEANLRSQVQQLSRQLRQRVEEKSRVAAEESQVMNRRLAQAKAEADELRVIIRERDTAIESRNHKEKALCAQLAEMEKQLQQHDLEDTTGIFFTAEERQELHRQLRDTQARGQELQRAVSERDQLIKTLAHRDEQIRAQLKRLREERNAQTDRGSTTAAELEKIQRCHDRAVEHFSKQQRAWESERRSLLYRVQLSDPTETSLCQTDAFEVARLEQEMREKAKQHQRDIKHWTVQLQSLQQRLEREQGFRADLAWEKKYHLLQLDMYEAYNKLDLQILRNVGCEADTTLRETKPKLRTAVLAVMAALRIKKRYEDYASAAKVRGRKVPGKVSRAARSSRRLLSKGGVIV